MGPRKLDMLPPTLGIRELCYGPDRCMKSVHTGEKNVESVGLITRGEKIRRPYM